MRSRFFSKPMAMILASHAALLLSACSNGGGGGGGGSSSKPIAPYCPYLPSKTFSPAVTVSGTAYYEFRSNGNGPVSDGVHTLTPTVSASASYAITVNGRSYSATCAVACTASDAVTKLKASFAADSSAVVTATGSTTLILTPKVSGPPITISGLGNLTDTADTWSSPNNIIHQNPGTIKYAEVQVTDPAGTIVQCTETNASGAFTFQLPADNATYTIKVFSRSNNSYNTAYVMNNPTDNTPYNISTTVTASGTPSPILIAKATSDLVGGAFNILDQIGNAQKYLRDKTQNCNVGASTNYYPDCSPFTTAPVVNVYWTKGLTPAVYQGGSNGISFYGTPDGDENKRGLYILGGINGDTDVTDMDHFDNSVIVHEYGHFIEEKFSRPDSPGGSHDGRSIIDPRLAWGEGWADFFQGAVLEYIRTLDGATTTGGAYRDTYGHVGCTGGGSGGCTGVWFNEALNVDAASCSSCNDKPSVSGEGNFHEFSISRLLYIVATSTSKFSEIWTAVRGPTQGMAVVSDRFKTITRLHAIQLAITGKADWSTLRTNEKHIATFDDYATPFNQTCGSTSKAMAIKVVSNDSGSFASSNQFYNNDFYRYAHPGGALSLALSWSGTGIADLDVYIYKEGYVYGSGYLATSEATTNTTSGSESLSASLAAGNYLINIKAFTGHVNSSYPETSGYPYAAGASGTYNTTYNLTLNGAPVCPTP